MISANLRGRRILIVEDEGVILLGLEDLLLHLGCEIAGSTTRAEVALKLARNMALDAAILDVNLGGGESSYAVADLLAERGVPFIFLTGYGPRGLDERYRDRPVMSKPIDEEALETLLGKLLGGDR